jgi:DNA repair exonuclease SbcCD ATPase subunit
MKEIKLQKLHLINFKGISSIEINFTDLTVISGANATGKTTLMDAFTWVLFGKDSEDRKDFNIKTLDSWGKVIEKLDHEVEATLNVSGETVVLRRCYREKWTTKRGSEEPELTGHETVFFWNDVPLQAGEYQQKIDQILTESTFKLITNPLYFNQMKWQDRRNILVKMAGEVETPKKYASLIESMGNKTLDEYRKELAARKKKLNDELKTIPARIDEVERSKPQPKDWEAISREISENERKLAEVEAEITDSSQAVKSVLDANKDRFLRINELKTMISDIEFNNHRELNRRMNERDEKIREYTQKTKDLQGRINTNLLHIDNLVARTDEIKSMIEKLREEWKEENAREFTLSDTETVCPTCLRPLDQDDLENKMAALRALFNTEKKRRLQEISRSGKNDTLKLAEYESEIASLKSLNLEEELEEVKKQLREVQEQKLEKVPYPAEYSKYQKELASLEEVKAENVKTDNTHLLIRRSSITEKIAALKHSLSLKSQIEAAETRKEELLRQEKTFSQQLADIEKIEFTIQNFIREKVNLLEGRINGMFETVRFRLFDVQINGGIIECCDTLVDGVPWQDANNAAKINSGIDIINVLSNFYDVSAPVWVDNAESVNLIQPTVAQRIELYVTNDNYLTTENY